MDHIRRNYLFAEALLDPMATIATMMRSPTPRRGHTHQGGHATTEEAYARRNRQKAVKASRRRNRK